MIKDEDVLSFNYYTYGEPFTGSDQGKRFRLSRISDDSSGEEKQYFEAVVWPEPFAEDFTDDEKKLKERFPFTEEGKDEAVDWINSATV